MGGTGLAVFVDADEPLASEGIVGKVVSIVAVGVGQGRGGPALKVANLHLDVSFGQAGAVEHITMDAGQVTVGPAGHRFEVVQGAVVAVEAGEEDAVEISAPPIMPEDLSKEDVGVSGSTIPWMGEAG